MLLRPTCSICASFLHKPFLTIMASLADLKSGEREGESICQELCGRTENSKSVVWILATRKLPHVEVKEIYFSCDFFL